MPETGMVDLDGESLLLFPTITPRALASAIPGVPSVTLPAGRCPKSLPFGMDLIGRANSDRHLLMVAGAVEDILAHGG